MSLIGEVGGDYQRTFVEVVGPWPHPCFFCDGEVDGHTVPFDSSAAVVHHINGEHWDNRAENLAPTHHGCHVSFHHLGKTIRPEYVDAVREALSGRVLSAETRAKISAGRRGRTFGPLADEHRATISAAKTGVPQTPSPRASCRSCRGEFATRGIGRHLESCRSVL